MFNCGEAQPFVFCAIQRLLVYLTFSIIKAHNPKPMVIMKRNDHRVELLAVTLTVIQEMNRDRPKTRSVMSQQAKDISFLQYRVALG